eukprot:CAMPEP_0172183012 /NCGR_PEP_ID=MMETSP1050-20130122/18732_1 /TAXON_ID=233186 /ORGANISM="Cryptomonas curvata, Strain CCAP979/52" /LENGTH=193 /DNA_ID=CAMNT_0012856549 /DNA_START=213 /DNA_END=792 /DNA_ORIENTATION=+
MLLLTVPVEKAFAVPYPRPTSSPIVIEGQMRLEQGSEKILEAVGGRANATVVLRIVGRGIISTTHLEIDVADFPPPGQPKPGESGGVPFYVTEADLNAKTEKGVTVTRTLWADDDIFVRIDVNSERDGKARRILKGIGKAKYAISPDGAGFHQKPLVLLDDAAARHGPTNPDPSRPGSLGPARSESARQDGPH